MFKIKNLYENQNLEVLDAKSCFEVVEYKRDLSLDYDEAISAYFANAMNIRARQLVCTLDRDKVTLQAGIMQWMTGSINVSTGVKGVGDFFGKMAKGMVTKESSIKPEYGGCGKLVCEPTYKHILLFDMEEWGGSVVLDDGLFLACESTIRHKLSFRSNASSAFLGNEGLVNLKLEGPGVFAIESSYPKQELVEVYLEDDVIKIDGNMAVAWSSSLDFTVEKTTRSLVGSAASGEGFVNVYRGTGKVLMAPFQKACNANQGSAIDENTQK